jgi:uncharacterized protein DUF4383
LRTLDPVRLTWLYVLVLGAGLLLDGGLLLVLNGLGVQVPGVNTTDVRHNLLHLVSGVVLLAVSIRSKVRAMWAALIFGAFYVALGVLGLTIDQPFGLQLGPGENAFHFTVGPLALLLGAWALRTSTLALPPPSRNGALPAGSQNGSVARRRARRRRGKARGHERRH